MIDVRNKLRPKFTVNISLSYRPTTFLNSDGSTVYMYMYACMNNRGSKIHVGPTASCAVRLPLCSALVLTLRKAYKVVNETKPLQSRLAYMYDRLYIGLHNYIHRYSLYTRPVARL